MIRKEEDPTLIVDRSPRVAMADHNHLIAMADHNHLIAMADHPHQAVMEDHKIKKLNLRAAIQTLDPVMILKTKAKINLTTKKIQ